MNDLKNTENAPKIIILDDNELSILAYAREYPENWKRICNALDKSPPEKAKPTAVDYLDKEDTISQNIKKEVEKDYEKHLDSCECLDCIREFAKVEQSAKKDNLPICHSCKQINVRGNRELNNCDFCGALLEKSEVKEK